MRSEGLRRPTITNAIASISAGIVFSVRATASCSGGSTFSRLRESRRRTTLRKDTRWSMRLMGWMEKEDRVMLQRSRASCIFYRKNFFPYPIGITLTVARRLGLLNTILIGLSYVWRQLFPMKDETYLDAFYRNR